ncbi:hypothetical protein [Rhodococcus olei]
MLELVDARTRATVRVPALPGGITRVAVHPPSGQLQGLRVLLVADLIGRVLEDLHAAQVLTAWVGTEVPDPAVVADLMIRRPADIVDSPAAVEDALVGPVALTVGGAADPAPTDRDGHRLHVTVGDVRDDRTPRKVADPATLRLMLLATRHERAVTLTDEGVEAADRMLRRWRGAVAAWSRCASAPLARSYTDAVHRALDTGLDFARAIALLRSLESDPRVPDGAKFETVVHLDRTLGLDLVRGLSAVPPS